MSEVSVSDNPDELRFEARVDGALAAFTAYQLSEGVITFTHTEVDEAYEGQGIGSTLVRYALDSVRADTRLRVRPSCPFVRSWIDRHPDYADLTHRR